ncbi:NAD(P)/FAD-dependent oxidoreductase [Ancylobacter sp. Lp-2]|uniref:NAD(P)/FAD-dependent oxidoreductase n=1 Tax=Ancylobacter sp. Lp-2 TaxID=2881339 RepID=UPI00351D0007|nr:NAD(P)/FAD-dependent oxidoreductase [Ancylobacter sp. Lp-2]
MSARPEAWDVVVIGAGAAGLMCAIEVARRGRRTLVIDHARAPGEKIRISGGGRCNFTNIGTSPKNFLSANPGFCISALKRYSQQDFIALVRRHGIAFHEKTLGQLFCDGSARQIVDLLLRELHDAGGELRLATTASLPERTEGGFRLATSSGALACDSLVVATGGKSIPKMGATGFGYDIAERFGLAVTPTRPALVPLTLDPALLERLAPLAGIGLPARAGHGKTRFDEAILFTHRGLSGPAVLQISSYWREGDEIALDLAPGIDVFAALKAARAENGRQAPASALAALLPRRLAQLVADTHAAGRNLADLSDKALRQLALAVNEWRFKPTGSEGYRTAEVTLGGVDTAGLDQKTLQAKTVPGLFFIGEVVDVTGWLGGYNFQWAWSSGWAAGQAA